MTHNDILRRVCRAIDILIEAGDRYEGLFPSLIDRQTHRMMETLPPAIPGQRMGDRAHMGSNLMHDHSLIKAMYGLSHALGKRDYGEAADRYINRFATHCTDTVTGLFPWGEHSFWHLVDDAVGNSYLLRDPDKNPAITHDHLRQAPIWLWEKLWAFNPRCVERFAEGLNGHWTEGEPLEYIRHAYIQEKRPYRRGARSCDFPRHGGFYILDWGYAYFKIGRPDFLKQIEVMLDYWWPRRDDLGLLLIESRSPETEKTFYQVNSVGQTLSLGVSLLESADLLESREPGLANRMRERGRAYIDGFLAAPHNIEQGVFVGSCQRGTNEILNTLVTWGSKYGEASPSAGTALIALLGYRLTGDERLFDWARAAALPYRNTPLPKNVAVPAKDPGAAIGLLSDLYEVTGDDVWLADGLKLAGEMMAAYMDADLPRGSSKTEVYESQLGPGNLLYALARIGLLAQGREGCLLGPDYTGR